MTVMHALRVRLLWVVALCVSGLLAQSSTAHANTARFGYFWKDNTLPYDTRFTYQFDVAAYPNGVFSDPYSHSFAYIPSQPKHVVYNGIPYGVELVLQYGYDKSNADSIKRVWLSGLNDLSRFTSPWISSDASGSDFFELSTLDSQGYLDPEHERSNRTIKFLRARQEVVFVSGSSSSSTWQNRILFYNWRTGSWKLKAMNTFTVPASREVVRKATYEVGDGVWSGILETNGDHVGPPDYGQVPVKRIIYRNRSVTITDRSQTYSPQLDSSNQNWICCGGYKIFYRTGTEFGGAGGWGYHLDSQWVAPTGTVVVPSGGSQIVTVSIRNASSRTWDRRADNLHYVDSQGRDLRYTSCGSVPEWHLNRRAAFFRESTVPPGGIAHYILRICGKPDYVGRATMHLQSVAEDEAHFGPVYSLPLRFAAP